MAKRFRRFTYGDQFDPTKFELTELLELCVEHEPDRYDLQNHIKSKYFQGHGRDPQTRDENSTKMAMNCVLSLNAYKLIRLANNGKKYKVTELAHDLLSIKDDRDEVHKRFALHILTNLEGLLLARLVERIRARDEKVTLEYLGEEFNDIGIRIPPNSTYISTMRNWLAQAGVFHDTGYYVNWDIIFELLNIDKDFIDGLYQLDTPQKYYLLSMANLNIRSFIPSNKIAKYVRSIYKIRLTTKNLVKDILEPLESMKLIETRKTTTGRGAKPHDVRMTEKGKNEVIAPLVSQLANLSNLPSSDLNRPFEEVVADLSNPDKYVRGVALELFAVWIIRLLGIHFSKWRLRHFEATGGGEVDVLAASDKVVYNRWQIQCKNQRSRVGVDVIAKEVGLTFLTKADVIMLVTTSGFAVDAINYSNQVNDHSRYYVILLDGDDVKRIVSDRTQIVDILNLKARRVFAKREMGITDSEELEDILEEEKQPETVDELEAEIRRASAQKELNDFSGKSAITTKDRMLG
jgi:site-specific DNA-methyltransferase (cytosine-N4-specific)